MVINRASRSRFTFFSISCLMSLWITTNLHGVDNAHFYRATNIFPLPELDQDWFSLFNITLAGGTSKTARNKNGQNVPLLDIYGVSVMHDLGVGVPNKDLNNFNDLLLTELSLLPSRDCFTALSISGQFTCIEANLWYTQHFKCGGFLQAHIPIRRLTIADVAFCDLSPIGPPCPDRNNQIWQTFLTQFQSILHQYCITNCGFNKTGVGDLSILGGWTRNFYETRVIDFFDITLKAGILIPTGATTDINDLFSLPLGYNGHVGVPLSADIAWGAFEWLLLAFHYDAIVFAPRTYDIRVFTSPLQQGIVQLTTVEARVNEGTVWTAGALVKADHFIRGLSLTLGYTFANQQETTLSFPCAPCIATVCDVEQFKKWRMSTITVIAEYDYIFWGDTAMHTGLFANIIAAGQRIFNTHMYGVYIGGEISWDF